MASDNDNDDGSTTESEYFEGVDDDDDGDALAGVSTQSSARLYASNGASPVKIGALMAEQQVVVLVEEDGMDRCEAPKHPLPPSAAPRLAPIPPAPGVPVAAAPSAVITPSSTTANTPPPPPPQATGAENDPQVAAEPETCATCNFVMYTEEAKASADGNLECVCCRKLLPTSVCFSKSQQKEGKHRCKACLNNAFRPPGGKAPSKKAIAALKRREELKRDRLVRNERKVAKLLLAKRALERKRKANDLRGSTRVEYEKQLDQEEKELKALERKLRKAHPAVFEQFSDVKIRPPSLPVSERDVVPKKRKSARVQEAQKEKQARKQQEKELRKQEKAAAIAKTNTNSSVDAGAASEGAKVPETMRLTEDTPDAPIRAVKAAKPKRAAASGKREVKPKKRNASSDATTSSAAAEGKPKKTRKTVSKADTTGDQETDPWVAAHAEIAQGLSQLLEGSLPAIFAQGVGELDAKMSKAKKSSSTSTTKSTTRAKVKAEAMETKSKAKRTATAAAKKKQATDAVKSEVLEGAPTTAAAVTTEKTPRIDPSTYAPKTEFQAITPPATTIVTRARKRTLQPIEVIDITDSPSPKAKRSRA